MQPAKRIATIPPYLFAQIDKKKNEAIARGVDVINLGVGDPDQPTPSHIVEAMRNSTQDAATHNYPPYEGTENFRRAVASYYQKRFGVELDHEREVMALIGSKEGIAHVFYAFVDPGDLTLVPDPAYPVYKTSTLLAGGIPHAMPLLAKNKFLPDFSAIPTGIAEKAKLMFLNYPNNPTGAVCDKKFFEEAVAFASENDILLCHDLAYSEITFDGYVAPSVLEVKGAKSVAIEFNSLSKTYNMTGWRLGMAVGSAEAINALGIIKTNTDSGAFKAIQEAGIVALGGSQGHLNELNQTYRERRDVLLAGLKRLGWDLEPNRASFYVWVPIPEGTTSMSFAGRLLDEAGIIVPPGVGYGDCGEGYIRFALTAPLGRIREAVARMEKNNLRFR
ncbi:MAG TPA: LL-diaminopimelate aminotransferase [Chroococcales cyanobacterium]|jgi:LL-diaminopimelate aminotransferase